MEHMFVLGIDPGLTRTGYGVIASSGSSERAVAAGVIHTDPGAPMPGRLAELAHDLREVVAEHHHREFGIDCSPDDILVGPGSKELMFLLQAGMGIIQLIWPYSWLRSRISRLTILPGN